MRLPTSFLKQEPPKPNPAFKNCGPMRGSNPIDCATSCTSAPVASQIALIELILLIRCASMAFATSFESSEDQTFVLRIFECGTHAAYTLARAAAARWPWMVLEEPMSTRSGCIRFLTAVPSDKNSGLESTSNRDSGRRLSSWKGGWYVSLEPVRS